MFSKATPEKIILISRDPRQCNQCKAIERSFKSHEIEEKYEVEKIDGDALTAEQLEWLKGQGLAQVPVLFTPLEAPKDAVAGFRPDVLKDLANYAKERDEKAVEAGAA